MVKYICDNCGKEIDKKYFVRATTIILGHDDCHFEICRECWEFLIYKDKYTKIPMWEDKKNDD